MPSEYPARFGRSAVHVVLLLLKSALAVGGFQAARRNLTYLSGPPTSNPPPAKKKSTYRADKLWVWAYIVMNLVDIAKTVAANGTTSEHIHHVATAFGYTLDALFGSARTMALARISLVGEVVAPFYQMHHLLKALGLSGGALSRFVVLASAIVTVLVRIPLCAWCAYIAVRDAVLKAKRWSQRSKGSTSQTNSRGDPLVSLDGVQPELMLPSAMGSLLIAGLDMWWLVSWSLPLLTSGPRGPSSDL